MTNTEILNRLVTYTQDALKAAVAADEYNSTGHTQYAVSRATAAYEATKLEARWSKGEICFSDDCDPWLEKEVPELTGDCRG